MPLSIFNNQFPQQQAGPQSRGPLGFLSNINPFYIHLMFIIIIIILLFLFFSPNSAKNNDDKLTNDVSFVGEVIDFNISYLGNLTLHSSHFSLETSKVKLNETNKNFLINNFNGNIYYKDDSIFASGTADRIKYGENIINLDGDSFVLNSDKKVTFDMYFDNLNITFNKGRIKMSDSLNYELDNSTINVLNFNASVSYDSIFSFSGNTDYFKVETKNKGITILFENE